MANTIITVNLLQKEVMRKLRKTAVIWQTLPDKKYQEQLKHSGNTCEIESVPKFALQHGAYSAAGATISEQNTVMTSETITLDRVIQDNRPIRNIEQIQANTNLFSLWTEEMAKSWALDYDSYIARIATSNANSSNLLHSNDPQTLAKGTIAAAIGEMSVKLRRFNAGADNYLFVPPEITELLVQSECYIGFKEGLDVQEGAQIGHFRGFKMLESNNLPEKRKLTVAAASTGDGTYVINVPNPESGSDDTVTFTAKAAPSAAGEFDIAASAAAQQTIIQAMINGTGTCGATNYIALSAADRAILKRGMVYCGDFASNAASVFGRRGCTFSETDNANNAFGTAGTVMFAADKLSVNFIEQEAGFKIVGSNVNNQAFAANVMLEKAFTAAVLTENAKRISVFDVTNGATT